MGLSIYAGVLCLTVVMPYLADPEVRRTLRRRREAEKTLSAIAEYERTGGRVQAVEWIARSTRRISLTFWFLQYLPFIGLAVLLAIDSNHVWVSCLITAAFCIHSEVRGDRDSEPRNAVGLATPPSSLLRKYRVRARVFKGSLLAIAGVTGFYAVTSDRSSGLLNVVMLSAVSVLAFKYSHVPILIAERVIRRFVSIDFDALPAASSSVLLLRSFSSEQVSIFNGLADGGSIRRYLPGRQRFEEMVVRVLVRMGQTVTVGNPDEQLPLLGASRTYREHDDWRDAVMNVAEDSKAIIVLAGTTESLTWELGELRRLDLLKKVLVLFPPGTQTTNEEQYTRVCAQLSSSEVRLPDELIGCLVGLTITPDGRVHHHLAQTRSSAAIAATIARFAWKVEGVLADSTDFVFPDGRDCALAPVHEALVALEHGYPALAKHRLAGAKLSHQETLAIRIWEIACLKGRPDDAAQLVSHDAASEVPLLVGHDAILHRLLKLTGQANASRELLLDLLGRRTSIPERETSWNGCTDFLHGSANGCAPTPLSRSIDAFNVAEKTLNQAGIEAAARDVLAAAEVTGEETLIAGAEVHLGETLSQSDPIRAEEHFERASRLRDANKVIVHMRVPVWDPDLIVYRAKRGLQQVHTVHGVENFVDDGSDTSYDPESSEFPYLDPVRDRLW